MYISPTPLFFLHIKKAEIRRKSEERKRCSCTWVHVSFSRWFAITPSGTTKSSVLTISAAYLTLSTLHPLFKQPLVQQVFRAGDFTVSAYDSSVGIGFALNRGG